MSEPHELRRAFDKALERAKHLNIADEVSETTLDVMILRQQVRALAAAIESLGGVLGIKRQPGLAAELVSIERNLRAQVGAFEEALKDGDLDAAATIPHMPPLDLW